MSDELSRVESRLSALVPTASRICRDELMYRAGFAAGRAKPYAAALRWIAPLASAAAAAFVAVVVTRQSTPAPPGQLALVPTATSELAATVSNQPQSMATAAVRHHGALRFTSSNAPLLAMRERALRFDFDDPPLGPPTSVAAIDPRASLQDLRNEFLPQRQPLEFSLPTEWLHPWTSSGETI